MRSNRPSLISGLSLIALGLVFLANFLIPGAWPIFLVGLGACFLAAAFLWRQSGLTITGTTNLALGGILLYQSLTQDWSSWFFLWPLLFSAVGAGMLLVLPLEASRQWARGRYLRVSAAFLVVGLLAAAGLWIFRARLEWPVVIWGMGGLFLLVALVSQVTPLLIPAAILGGIGGLLAWQNASGDWASWAYAWALLPGFVGLGLFLAFLHSRVMRAVGLSMLGWSLVVFALFAIFFARGGSLARFWPVGLILAGLVVLLQTLVLPRRPRAV
jgi:hypothetical protein